MFFISTNEQNIPCHACTMGTVDLSRLLDKVDPWFVGLVPNSHRRYHLRLKKAEGSVDNVKKLYFLHMTTDSKPTQHTKIHN